MDERFLDPPLPVLASALDRAADAAGQKKGAQIRLEPTPADRARLLAAMAAGPTGMFEVFDLRTGQSRIEIDWWTDPARRRHVRVRGFRLGDRSEVKPYIESRADGVPPVGRVYPGSLVGVHHGRQEVTLAACNCGAVGSPDAIAWSGVRCGPCADAEAEGRPVPPPVWVYGLGGGVMRFTPDGYGLVTDTADGQLAVLDMRTGGRTVSVSVSGRLVGVAFEPDGRTVRALTVSNTLVRWDISADALTRTKTDFRFGTLLSPDGQHAVSNLQNLYDEGPRFYAIDWENPNKPTTLLRQSPDLRGGAWTRDGSAWVGLAADLSFVSVAMPSTARTVLRERIPDGMRLPRHWHNFMDAFRVVIADPDLNLAVFALHDDEHGFHGPAQVGGVGTTRVGFAVDDPDDDFRMPQVLGFTPDGEWLLDAFGGGVGFNPTTPGRKPVTVRGLGLGWNRPDHVAFSPDGETLACHVPDTGGLWLLPWKRILAAVGVTA